MVLLVVAGLAILLIVVAAAIVLKGGGEAPASVIAGWELFEGGGVSLQLPESFEGGNPASDPDAVAEQLRAMGGDYRAIAEWVSMNKDSVLIIAADSASASSDVVSNVNVVAEKVPSSMSMDEYVASGAAQVPPPFEIEESGVVTVGGRTVGRLVTSFVAPGGQQGMQLAYAFKDGGTVSVVTYTTSAQEWGARLPVFERSAATFRY